MKKHKFIQEFDDQSSQEKYIKETQKLYHWYGMPLTPNVVSAILFLGVLLFILFNIVK